jgi:hypothetical protein
MAIRAAQGERIVRMDAHTGYPKEYISTLINWQDRLGVENVGCAVETRVEREDDVGQAIELALSSRMGVGDSAFRVGTGDVRDVDTVPFGCYRREVFDRIGLFDERLIRNQDIEFNRRLRAAGGRVVLIPGLRCTYYGPSSLKSLAVKSYQNGFWNLRTVAFTRNWGAVSLRHFAPGAFLLSLGVPLGATWFWGSAWVFSAGFAGAYLLCLVAALAPSIRRNPRLALLLPITVMLMHFAYGFGSLMGALRLPWTWLKPRSRRDGLPSTPVEAVPYSGQRRVQPKDTP